MGKEGRALMKRTALLIAIALAAMCCFAGVALADSSSLSADDGNQINTQQVPDSNFLYDTSIYDLNNADTSYQGQTVQITGEVIGDSIKAEEDAGMHWITLYSNNNGKEGSISVLIDDSYLSLIDMFGEYGKTGTTLQVRGTFHLACPSHEGIVDIHADSVSLVEHGKATPDVFDIKMFIPGIAMCCIGAALAGLFHYLRERQR